jgi:DNA-binding transcriptional MerR regulator
VDVMNRDEGQGWKIGELALATGLTVRSLHHYDEVGLLRPSGRTPAGHRLYDAGDVQRLYQVVTLRELGLPLNAINAVLDSAPDPAVLLREHLAHLDRRLEVIRTLRRRVAAVVAGTHTAGRPPAAELLDLIREVITVDETVDTYFGATHQPSMDPTFYRSPAEAVAAPPETLAYVAAFDRSAKRPDALAVINVEASSQRYGQVVGWADLPTRGDELHHFGWNACSSALMHAGHEMGAEGLQRRYLLLPGLRSSHVHVYDTQPRWILTAACVLLAGYRLIHATTARHGPAAPPTRPHRDSHIAAAHAATELAMAAMFAPVHPLIPATIWVPISAVFTAGTLTVPSRRGTGHRASQPGSIAAARDRAHLAMLTMSMVYAVVAGSTPAGPQHHATTPAVTVDPAGTDINRMAASTQGAPPILAWLLASYFIVYAALSATRRLNKQPTPPPAHTPPTEHHPRSTGNRVTTTRPNAVKPALLTSCDATTSVAMAYMLLT